MYFYTDLSNGFEDWVTEFLQLEQFYLLGSSIRLRVGKEDTKEYFDDVVALEVSLKEKKLVIYELDIFSEIKKKR